MVKKRPTASRGFTLVELIIAMAALLIVVLTIGMGLVHSQRNWSVQYDRIYADVVTEGYVARRKFDAVMRKASREKLLLDDAGSWVEVHYYADEDSAVVDRYARFYAADRNLDVEYGQLNPRETLSVETVCGNVSGLTFEQVGRSIQMILTLDDGTRTNTVISSAVTHN
jgi:prepilin-type N-terminal cleavage/methylation domain-containing protein